MIDSVTEEQITELSERFARAIHRLPKVMAESWLANPAGFRNLVRELMFVQQVRYLAETYKSYRLSAFRRDLQGKKCPTCNNPMSGLIKFRPSDTGQKVHGFSKPQDISVVCGFCGEETTMDFFDLPDIERNFSKPFKEVRRVWRKCAPVLDVLVIKPDTPGWAKSLHEAIREVRVSHLEADILLSGGPGTVGWARDSIRLGNVRRELKKVTFDIVDERDPMHVVQRFKKAYLAWMGG
jgi:hypothetical protein